MEPSPGNVNHAYCHIGPAPNLQHHLTTTRISFAASASFPRGLTSQSYPVRVTDSNSHVTNHA